MKDLTDKVINDESTVYQKQEVTRKIIYSQVNFLKDRLKMELQSRKMADQEIYKAIEKYKELIYHGITK